MIGLSAQAQSWVAPTITGDDPVSGVQYKVMNVGAGTFLDMGKAWFGWSTTAILSETGINFTMTADGDNWKFIRTGSQGVFTSGNGIAGDAMHVDNTAQTYGISKLGNGCYHIHDVGGNASSLCWGNDGTTVGVVAHADATVNGWSCDWVFIQPANVATVAAIYNARLSLYNEYLKAVAEGASTDDAAIVYNNNSATVDELNAATAALHTTRYNHALAVASNEDPREITEWVLTNADFSAGNINGWETNYVSGVQAQNIGYQGASYSNGPVVISQFIEAWKPGATLGDGYLRQTVQNLPEGKFVLEADAIATWQNDDSRQITGAQLYITADGVTYKTDMSTKNGKPQHFSTEFLNTGEGDVIFGLRTVSANCNWLCADNFKVTFYGIDLSPYATLLAQAVAEAQAVEGTVPANVYNALAAVVTANNKAWETSKEYTTAIAAIQNATDNAKAIQNAYAKYNALKAAALAIAENTNTVDADASANAASDGAAIEAAIVQLRAAFLAELPNLPVLAEGIDVTSVMVENASVRQGVEGWTISDVVRMDEYGTGPTTNYEETEFYHSNFRIYQTLALTPGTWEFGVTGFHRAGNHNTHFYAGEDQILIPGVESSVVNSMAEAQTYFNNGNGKVALKFLVEAAADIEIGINNQDTETDRWTIFRDFTLKYYGAPDYTVYKDQWSQAVTDAEDALTTYADYDSFTATEKSTLEGAKANAPAVDEKKAGYITKINALTDATAAYIALSKKYESAKTAIARANAIKEAHNFASAEAITTFTNAINAFSDKYDDLTLTEEDAVAAATNLGSLVTGHRAGANTAASNYLENGFGLNDFDADLCVNTWSTEGDTDGSGFSVPFYEYWTEDANSLGEQTWSGTLTGLEEGLYEVSAWVRVRAKNEVTAGDATGITMDVNGGGEGDYAAVDVTEGAQIGESQFQIETYTAKGLVTDGNLTLNFNIAADNNISWLSFKNLKYERIGDLPVEPTTYVVNIAATENGTVEADKATAAEGETVSVTVTPAEGFMVDQAYWTANEENHEIEEPEEGNQATFTMPAADVTITVTFKEIEDEPIVVPTIDATLVHTASSYCEGDANVYISKVDAEAEHVNNSKFSSTWQGAAYAEFSFETLPANAEITEAILTFTGIGESRNARNTDVMIVNVGSTLDYTAMEAGDAKVNLPATTIQSVSFPKASSQEFNIDATEQLKALVAEGQKFAIFKFTNNPGSGDVAGKASENAPKLVITYAPGAPEVANASFEADGEKKASNGAIEMTGWTFAGVGTQFNNTELRSATTEGSTSQFGTSDPSDGEYSLFFRQGWNNGGNVITITSAALDEIPAGDYTLSIDYKQHYSYDNDDQKNENTKVTIALKNGEDILGSETSPAAAGVKGGSGDATYFNDAEWSTLTASFTIDKAVAAGAQVVITLNSAGARRSDFYLDNVKLTKVPGIELAKAELQKAIDAAQAEAAKYVVGEELFMYPASEIAPLTTAIATATDALNDAEATKESITDATTVLNAAVEAFAPQATQPDAEKLYTFKLRLDGETPLYMNLTADGISIAEEATALKFVTTDAAGQFNLANADETLFVGLAGGNAWTMSTAADKKAAWTFTALGEGAYRINNLVTAGRFVGTNAAEKEAGSPCYADKLTSNGNVDWIIAEYTPTPVGIKGFAIDDKKAAIYDLSGRKVEKIQRGGVYIIDGKKVSVK